jgi:hypothetical protein
MQNRKSHRNMGSIEGLVGAHPQRWNDEAIELARVMLRAGGSITTKHLPEWLDEASGNLSADRP